MATKAKAKKTYEVIQFYGGQVRVEKVPYGDYTRYRVEGEKSFLLSATRVTGTLDKSRFLIPWATGLVASHVRERVNAGKGPYSIDEIMLIVDEAARKPEEKKVAGGDTGTVIHKFCHDFALAKMTGSATPTLDAIDESTEEGAKALNGINAFLDWYNGNKVEFLAIEQPVYYHCLAAGDGLAGGRVVEYVGVMDALARVNGEVRVIDYKTSKGVYDDQRFQVAAYAKAIASDPSQPYTPDGVSILNFNKETGDLVAAHIPMEEVIHDYAAFVGLYIAASRCAELSKAK